MAALVGHLAVPAGLLRRELPLVGVATAGFAVAVQNGLTRPEGLALLAGLATALWIIMRPAGLTTSSDDSELATEVEEFLAEEKPEPAARQPPIHDDRGEGP